MEHFPVRQIAASTGADSVELIESIQTLWSGYGEIVRVRLIVPTPRTAIVKWVSPPTQRNHKYGWTNDFSHQRKLDSYDNELAWYRGLAKRCHETIRVPQLIAGVKNEAGWIMVLEDLDAAGFDMRRTAINEPQLEACLSWLANLHAEFLYDTRVAVPSDGRERLWATGTYWHLATRPNELAAMAESPLKQHAAQIDAALSSTRFQTIVHGDAKLANFCFAKDDRVAAVDFQYVGGGCGIKDFAYFVSSCFSDQQCESREQELLDRYFGKLRQALERGNRLLGRVDEIEAQWRELYTFAWADFYRFLAGWSPGHWKMHGYSQRMADQVIDELKR